jgi:hypothetical protein
MTLKLFASVSIALLSFAASAQQVVMKTLNLNELSEFKPQAGNWQIVGDVLMNPSVDVHHTPIKPIENTGKKKKSTEQNTVVKEIPKAVTFTSGKGILLNYNDDTKKDNLVTLFEHGDIDLELEVMIPKGSNSGLYLQGRYEVQLFDSWGVKNATFSDIGGIYRNWEKEPGKIYMGKAPLSNACKAPGLWQSLKISFRAPKFDGSGKKIANAQFVSVELNGVKIHDHVEVPLPTGGPIENNEKPMGPIMIQGDHGAVAFRNIRYKMMRELKISIADLSYKTYKGNFKEIAQFATTTPSKSGTSSELTCEVLADENGYGLIYNGTLNVPEEGDYAFVVGHTGGVVLTINDETVVNIQRPDAGGMDYGTLRLKAGRYPFVLANFKDASWMPPRLGLTARLVDSYPVVLNAYNSYPPDDDPTSPILISVGAQPKLLRAFVDFNGKSSERLTHTIGVGDPCGINYVYDLESGNLACVWRGDFVNATPMWHDRGDGSFKPLGAVQYLFVNQPMAFLAIPSESFPAISNEKDFRAKGYRIEDGTGRPVFKYIYQGMEVEDKIYPDDNDKMITHEVTIKTRGTKPGLYYKLAEGSSILTLPDGTYVVDKHYYIKAAAASIREVNGKKELIVTLEGSALKYSIIW